MQAILIGEFVHSFTSFDHAKTACMTKGTEKKNVICCIW